MSYHVLKTTQNDRKLHICYSNFYSSFLYEHIIHEEICTYEINLSEQ